MCISHLALLLWFYWLLSTCFLSGSLQFGIHPPSFLLLRFFFFSTTSFSHFFFWALAPPRSILPDRGKQCHRRSFGLVFPRNSSICAQIVLAHKPQLKAYDIKMFPSQAFFFFFSFGSRKAARWLECEGSAFFFNLYLTCSVDLEQHIHNDDGGKRLVGRK